MIRKSSAFSLLEVSAVILIIGILIAGVVTANSLVAKSRLAAAQTLTTSSPINGIKDSALWLESAVDASFADGETSNNTSISKWNDSRTNSSTKVSVVKVGSGPVYSNTINSIHAVKFSGNPVNYLKVEDASFLNGTDYTILVLEKRQSSTAGYFIGDSSVSTANQTLLLGYSDDAVIAHSQGTGNVYNSNVSTYSSSSNSPRIFTFVSDSTNGKKTYINGILAAQSSDTSKLSNIGTLVIGKGYTGEIGEIAIFTRALKAEERKSIEDYLGKKYSTNIDSNSGTCLNGIVTTKGCSMDCNTSGVVGLSSPSTVADGATNVVGTCGVTGYAGNVTLSCGSGTGVLSASPSMCGCDDVAGYSLSGGVCISNCSYTVTGGSPSTGTVSAGPVSITCDTANHYSSTPFTATCSGGAAITGTCSCATGYVYSGGNCNSCDTNNGYIPGGGGTCVLGCTVPANKGVTGTSTVNVGSSTLTCNDTANNYTGIMSYTCGSDRTFVIDKSCKIISPNCTGNTPDTTTVPGQVIHQFLASGSLNCDAAKTVEIMVVGGGGSGGSSNVSSAGGGGGGGIVVLSSYNLAIGLYSVSIGNAGTAGIQNGNGGNSSFSSGKIYLIGYGGGAGAGAFGSNGLSGGSGGGGHWGAPPDGGASTKGLATQTINGNTTNISSAVIYGNIGGSSNRVSVSTAGGGGGGATSAGGDGSGTGSSSTNANGGNGGTGYTSSITGTSVTYGAGGGARGVTSSGVGGTGNGTGNASSTAASNATANTGSGGGAAWNASPGKGGSGIVVVRYPAFSCPVGFVISGSDCVPQ